MTVQIAATEHAVRSLTPWPEKYRPTRVEELALAPANRRLIGRYLEDRSFPNLLLHGPPGVGKTSLVGLLTDSDHCEVMRLDGGTDHSVEHMRGTVRTFVRTRCFRDRKVVVLDEAEGLSREAQIALRRLMEQQPDRVSFIIITNNAGALDPAVRSRSTSIPMSEIPLSERVRILDRVLAGEGYVSDDITVRRFASDHADLRSMIREAEKSYAQFGELRPAAPTRGGPRLLSDIIQDPEYSVEVPWDLEPFTARGCLTLVAGPAKLAGKSTLLRHYAAAKARGRPFLGQDLAEGSVLWVGPDEPIHHTARAFAEGLGIRDRISLWDVSPGRPPSIEDIVAEAKAMAVDLVILDTLPRVAGIRNENDNSEWNAWADKAMPLIRDSGAAFVAVHHHRKSGGSGGSAFRGGSAIFGLIDIGISLTPGGTVRRRTLTLEGSRFTPTESRTIELTADGYVDLGDGEGNDRGPTKSARADRVRDALEKDPRSVNEILDRVAEDGGSIGKTTVYGYLKQLVEADEAVREGSGARGDPYRWRRAN